MKIEELDFSVRTYNCLRRGKIETVEQLRETSDDDLMAIRCFGVGCLKEVHQKLGQEPPEKKNAKTCGGYCRCCVTSEEKQAIFTLGQMDMQESIILMLEDRKQKLESIDALRLLLDDVILMVRRM